MSYKRRDFIKNSIALTGGVLLPISFFKSDFFREQVYDVVVYGGTSAGVITAVQVSRMGYSVILIVNGQHLGGLTSSGLGRTDTGKIDAIGGFSREFYERIGKHYGKKIQFTFESHVAEEVFEQMVNEERIDVVRGERLERSKRCIYMEDKRIKSIKMESGKEIKGKFFIDASYVGDLMATAGVSYTVGRESENKYGESLAGTFNSEEYVRVDIDPYIEKGNPSSGLLYGIQKKGLPSDGLGDDKVQAYNYRLTLTKHNSNKIEITKPEGYEASNYELHAREIEILKQRNEPLSLNDFMIISMSVLRKVLFTK